MKTHLLKCWPVYFDRILNGDKPFEIRKNDRDYQAGDQLVLTWYDPEIDMHDYSQQIAVEVTYVLKGPGFGLKKGYCVMGIKGKEALPDENQTQASR